MLQNYEQTPKNLYCKFHKLVGHNENNCQAYEIMMEHGVDAYRMKIEEHGHEENGQHND